MVVVVNLLYGVFLPRHINPGVCVSYITKPSAPFTPSQLNPTIKSPKKDTRQMDLGTAPDGFFTRQMEILKKDRATWNLKIHPARCFQLARDLHWTGPKT